MANSKAPVIDNPQLIDLVLGEVQNGLIKNLGWLDMAFGRAQKLVKMVENKKYFTPNVYAGQPGKANDYIPVSPDSKIGNFSFFWIDDPQTISWLPGQQSDLKAPFSLIFWFDLKRVYNSPNNRNTELLKANILRTLNGGLGMRSGRIKINRIYEQAESIYKGFTLDEIDNQFLMHPYAGFRFEGELTILEPCLI
jgi:hypothetical protein